MVQRIKAVERVEVKTRYYFHHDLQTVFLLQIMPFSEWLRTHCVIFQQKCDDPRFHKTAVVPWSDAKGGIKIKYVWQ